MPPTHGGDGNQDLTHLLDRSLTAVETRPSSDPRRRVRDYLGTEHVDVRWSSDGLRYEVHYNDSDADERAEAWAAKFRQLAGEQRGHYNANYEAGYLVFTIDVSD